MRQRRQNYLLYWLGLSWHVGFWCGRGFFSPSESKKQKSLVHLLCHCYSLTSGGCFWILTNIFPVFFAQCMCCPRLFPPHLHLECPLLFSCSLLQISIHVHRSIRMRHRWQKCLLYWFGLWWHVGLWCGRGYFSPSVGKKQKSLVHLLCHCYSLTSGGCFWILTNIFPVFFAQCMCCPRLFPPHLHLECPLFFSCSFTDIYSRTS